MGPRQQVDSPPRPCRAATVGGALATAVALSVALSVALAAGCGDDAVSGPQPSERSGPVVYALSDSQLAAADTTATGLVFIPVEDGSGRRPGQGSIVAVHYTGMLVDGEIFDSSYPVGQPFRFLLGAGRVIAGWDEGIGLMREGGRARLVIPPELGYGDRGAGDGLIPPGATLVFDVWLVDVD